MPITIAPAFGAHEAFHPDKCSVIAAKVASPRKPTKKRHSWALLAEGAQRAASNADVRSAMVSDRDGSNERGLQRSARTGRIGVLVSAERDMGFP
jgi:hypothetical protein